MADDDKIPEFDDVMRLARRWHYSEIRSIADEAIKECLIKCADYLADDRREWITTWIDETLDGHQHVIYTGQASMVLAASDNEDAWEDEYGSDVAPNVSVRAFYAMHADLWQLLEARSDEWEIDPDDDDDDDDDDAAPLSAE